MSCAVTLDSLVDYWLGGPDTVEDHLFGCDSCTHRLGTIAALAAAIPEAMRRRGGMRLTLTAELAEHLERDGVVIRHYRPDANADVACTVAMEDDLSMSWTLADPRPDERVDLEVTGADGSLWLHAEDIPVDPAIGRIVTAVASAGLRPLPATTYHVRILAVGPAGERVLGEHTYRHTPMPAAP